MKNSKKGISLIVLVITIIVIIILAAAVLLTLNNNNPIENANTAVTESDKSEIQSAVTIMMSSIMADVANSVTLVPASDGAIVGTKFQITGSTSEFVKKGTSGKWEIGTSTEAYSITADDLGINATTLANYTIDANGKVSSK